MASPERAELIKNAIAFLSDPKSQSASLTQRIQFLEAKGLTPAEIDDVMRHSAGAPTTTSQVSQYQATYPQYGPTAYPMPGVPHRQPLDWRDYFIMAVVSGSFVYGAVTLARKYLLPHLRPPTSTAYEGDRDALTAQFDAAEVLLKEIQAETAAMRQAVDEQTQKVQRTTQDVESAVKEMREGDAKNRDEMREIRDEVNSIREMLPKMMDKNKESHTQSLAELQQELKSLKALLLSRGPSFPPSPSPSLPTFVGRPSIPAWQLSGSSTADSPLSLSGSATLPSSTFAVPAESSIRDPESSSTATSSTNELT